MNDRQSVGRLTESRCGVGEGGCAGGGSDSIGSSLMWWARTMMGRQGTYGRTCLFASLGNDQEERKKESKASTRSRTNKGEMI
jgi:hypothetical protein